MKVIEAEIVEIRKADKIRQEIATAIKLSKYTQNPHQKCCIFSSILLFFKTFEVKFSCQIS